MDDFWSSLFLKSTKQNAPPNNVIKRNLAIHLNSRETGNFNSLHGPPKELQWAAEDSLIDINRVYSEAVCDLPETTRSTFLMVFSPDGKLIASTHGDHNVYITDLIKGKLVRTLKGHPRTPWCIAFHPSSNQILASGCLGGHVRVWDLHGGSEVWIAESQTVIASLAFHPVHRILAIGSYNEIHFWDWSKDKPYAKCATANDKEKVRYVAFDENGCKLITGIANIGARRSEWDRVINWDRSSPAQRPQSPPQAPPPRPPPPENSADSRLTTFCYRYMLTTYEQLMRRYRELSRRGASLSSSDSLRPEDDSSRRNVSAGTDEITASLSSSRHLESRRSVGSTARSSVPPPPVVSPPPQEVPLPPSNQSGELLERLGELRQYIQAAWVQAMVEMQDRSMEGGARDETVADLARLIADIPGGSSRPPTNPASAFTSPPSSATPPTPTRPGPAARLADVLASGLRRLREINRQLRTLELGSLAARSRGTPQSGPANSSTSPSSLPTPTLEYNTLRMVEQILLRRIEEQEQVIESEIHRVRQFNSRIFSSRHSSNSQFDNFPDFSQGGRDLADGPHASSSADAVSHSEEHISTPRSQMGNLVSEIRERRVLSRLNTLLGRSQPGEEDPSNSPFSFHFRPRRNAMRMESANNARSNDTLDINNIRLGMQLLSYLIDNMSRLCRVRFEMVQLRQVRQMWDELQRSFGQLQNAVNGETGGGVTFGSWRPQRATPLASRGEAATTEQSSSLSDRRQSTSPGWHGPRFTGTSSVAETSDSSSVATSDSFHTPRRLRSLFTATSSIRLPMEETPGPSEPLPSTSRETPSTSTPATSSSGIDSEGDCSSSSSSRPPLLSFRRSARSSASKRARFEAAIRSTPRLYRYRSSRIAEMFYRQARSTATTDEGSDDENEGGNTSSSNGAVAAAIISQSRRKRTRPSPPSLQTISSHPDGGRQLGSRSNSSYQMPRLRAGCTRFNRHRTSPSFLPQRIMHRPTALYGYNRNPSNATRDISSQTPPFLIDASVGTEPEIDESELGSTSGRLRARQALLQMIESLMDFLENDTFTRNLPTDTVHRRIICLYNLLQRALELTQTLIVQVMPLRNNEEQQPGSSATNSSSRSPAPPPREEPRESGNSPSFFLLSDLYEQMRRIPRRSSSSAQINSSTSSPPSSSSSGSESVRRIPTLRVNDAPMPADYVPPPPLPREPPPPPPPVPRLQRVVQPRMFRLSPVDDSGDDSSPAREPPPPPPPAPRPPRVIQQRMFRLSPVDDSGDDSSPNPVVIDSSFYLRWISDHNMGQTHRIQAWDFTKCCIPQINNSQTNVVVRECRVHNDASVDISKDGKLLVALLPSVSMGPTGNTNMLGIYSLEWRTLGQCLYRTVCLQNAVSVSLSPTSRHLVVGLSSRRSLITLNFPQYLAQVCKLNGGEARIGGEKTGNLMFVREIKLPADSETISVNCIRWIPCPGSGFVYGTNTGQLKILR